MEAAAAGTANDLFLLPSCGPVKRKLLPGLFFADPKG